jgi:GT2 family glycosyltransferase
MRPESLLTLMQSVQKQTVHPDEILIIDGSTNALTEFVLQKNHFNNLHYYSVSPENRGLTKQRNFGVSKASRNSEIICFLDDDTVLEQNYFEEIIAVFQNNLGVVGVGGVAINEIKWIKKDESKHYNKHKYYEFEGYIYPESSRNILRNILGLQSDLGPGMMPEFSNGRTCGFPLNDKVYPVDLLVGMSFSFRKTLFDEIKFSHYFEGYGLYEDADFSIKALQYGKNVIATKAKLYHYHDQSGRPNKYNYGKMVTKNGWYVWRLKYPNPSFKAKVKWNSIVILLTIIRFSNTFTTSKRKEAFTEALGRTVGWFSLFFNKPK